MIPMYWWEGYHGLQTVMRRISHGKKPYVFNFGDQLSPLVVSLLSGQRIQHSTSSYKLLALGSIFFSLRDHDIVWGSGLIKPSHVAFAASRKMVKYAAVRGPKTRDILISHGIDCPEIYGDPALLLPSLIKNDVEKRYTIGLVPHFYHYDAFKEKLGNKYNFKLIDVERPYDAVVRDILSCEIILSSSLHGLIIGEAYGIPSLLLTMSEPSQDDIFKFEDYFHGTKRSLKFVNFSRIHNLNQLANIALSSTELLSYNTNPLLSSFPFPRNEAAHISAPGWNSSDFTSWIFKSSVRPPQWYIPAKFH